MWTTPTKVGLVSTKPGFDSTSFGLKSANSVLGLIEFGGVERVRGGLDKFQVGFDTLGVGLVRSHRGLAGRVVEKEGSHSEANESTEDIGASSRGVATKSYSAIATKTRP